MQGKPWGKKSSKSFLLSISGSIFDVLVLIIAQAFAHLPKNHTQPKREKIIYAPEKFPTPPSKNSGPSQRSYADIVHTVYYVIVHTRCAFIDSMGR